MTRQNMAWHGTPKYGMARETMTWHGMARGHPAFSFYDVGACGQQRLTVNAYLWLRQLWEAQQHFSIDILVAKQKDGVVK